MALNSRQPVERSITTAVVGLLTLGLLSSCGGNTSSSSQTATTQTTSASPTATTQPTSSSPTATTQPPSGGDRLGCGTYCQNAGGYGGAGNATPSPPAVTLVRTTVTADADGYVPLTLTCNLSVQCRGVLLLFPMVETGGTEGGRSDLLVDGGATRTIAVPVGALAFLRSHGPTLFNLTIDADQSPGGDGRMTGGDDGLSYRSLDNTLLVAPPTQPVGGSTTATPDREMASLEQLQQIAAADRLFVSTQLADRWVPQLSSKRPGVVDDGVVWDNTLTLQEHLRLRQTYDAKLLWSGDWSTFDAKDFWVTIAPITFNDSYSALQWCTIQGFDSDHCATKLVSTTHLVPGSFAHN